MPSPTARQLEVLATVIATGSQKAAAASLGISVHTVNGSIGRVRIRLGDVTMPQAIYILTARGLLVVTLAA